MSNLFRCPKPNGAKFLLLSLAVIVLDQITKYLCVYNIPFNTRGVEVLPFFNLVHVYNYGAAFSIFADWDGAQRYLLALIAIVMSEVFTVILLKTTAKAKWHCISYALFIGGAIGNLIDRVLHGYVIDFLLFYLKDDNDMIYWAYPAFNVADIAVCCGAALLVLLAFFSKDARDAKAKAKAEAAAATAAADAECAKQKQENK